MELDDDSRSVRQTVDVREQIESGRYDVVVVDCAPTAETLRLLSLPDALAWYMQRIWPVERRVVRRDWGRPRSKSGSASTTGADALAAWESSFTRSRPLTTVRMARFSTA